MIFSRLVDLTLLTSKKPPSMVPKLQVNSNFYSFVKGQKLGWNVDKKFNNKTLWRGHSSLLYNTITDNINQTKNKAVCLIAKFFFLLLWQKFWSASCTIKSAKLFTRAKMLERKTNWASVPALIIRMKLKVRLSSYVAGCVCVCLRVWKLALVFTSGRVLVYLGVLSCLGKQDGGALGDCGRHRCLSILFLVRSDVAAYRKRHYNL